MKDVLLLPVRFIAVFAILLVVGTAFLVLVDYATLDSVSTSSAGWLKLSVHSAFSIFLPVLCLTWMIISFGILHKNKFRFLQQLFLFIFLAGFIFLALFSRDVLSREFAFKEKPGFALVENKILDYRNGFILLSKDLPSSIQGVIIHENGQDESFVEIPRAIKDAQNQVLLFPEQDLSVRGDTINGNRARLFAPIGFLNTVAGALSTGNEDMFRLDNPAILDKAISAAAMAFLLISLWFFVRLSRWPFVNIAITGLALVGVMVGLHYVDTDGFANIFSFLPSLLRPYLVSMVMLVAGLILLGLNFLLPSAKDWKGGGLE